MATERKFKRGAKARLAGRDESMAVMHIEDTEVDIFSNRLAKQ